MWHFTELADGFDRFVHQQDVFLDPITDDLAMDVVKDPSAWHWTRFLAASFVQGALIKFAAGTVAGSFVDVLRIGDGIQEGGWGWGEDALRALIVVDALGKAGTAVARNFKGFVGAQQIGETSCAWLTGVRSLQMSGQKLGMSLTKLAAASGKLPFRLPEMTMVEFREVVRRVKGTVKEISALEDLATARKFGAWATRIEYLENFVKSSSDGLFAFGINYTRTGSGQRVGHMMAARYTKSGIEILDTTGRTFSSIEAMMRVYKNAVLIRDVSWLPTASWIGHLELVLANQGLLSRIALEVKPVLDVTAYFKNVAFPSKPMPRAELPTRKRIRLPPGQHLGRVSGTFDVCRPPRTEGPDECERFVTYEVGNGETIYSIAQRVYRDSGRWRTIYNANRDVFGPNALSPTLLREGQVLLIPAQ